ncbi:MAG: peptidylprolyl isomerase [Dehalococcoidia bacterium]|nr:peptidylprolyl isomerase [Dehalococcoidia bacterium]
MNKIKILIAALVAVMLFTSAVGCAQEGDTLVPDPRNWHALSSLQEGVEPKVVSWSAPPNIQIDVTKSYKAVFDTSLGSFEIELFAAESPLTVNNFIFLARNEYYDDTVFHRVVKEFVIQGGSRGLNSPGYTFADELPVQHLYEAGIVAMANSGENTNSSQFFVCTGSLSSSLNNKPNYSQFGRITSGMDTVLKIAAVAVGLNSDLNELSRPLNPPRINKVTIFEAD